MNWLELHIFDLTKHEDFISPSGIQVTGFLYSRSRKLLKDDLNGDTALDQAGTARERVLQRLELPKQYNGSIG